MLTFNINEANTAAFYASLAGVAVTGLTDTDITCYIYKQGGSANVHSLTGIVSEIDAVNMAGHYFISFPDTVFDTEGVLIIQLTGVLFDTFNVLAYVTPTKQDIRVIRALSHAQFKIENPVYDGNGSLTSCTLKGFAPGVDISVASPIITLNQTATYDATGNMTTFEVVE